MPYKDKEKQKAAQRAHYLANKETYVARSMERRAKSAEKCKQYLKDYLASHPCVDCGISDVRVLQFDHKELGTRVRSPRQWANSGSMQAMIAELALCEVRCANCHQIRTAEQFNWSRT